MSSPCRHSGRAGLILLAAVLAGPAAHAAAPLRLCVEPANLPFADAEGGGLDIAVARLLSRALDRELVLVPVAQGFHGYARRTLGEGLCDLLAGMPAAAEGALTTRPYYRSTWMFVVREGVPVPTSFDDPRLAGWRIAVPLVGEGLDTPPVAALARRGRVDRLQRFPVAARDQAAPLRAVASGAADLAVVWGPVAGWYAARSDIPLALGPTPEEDLGIPLTAASTLAVRRADAALRDSLNRAIISEGDSLAATLAAWHVPVAGPAGG